MKQLSNLLSKIIVVWLIVVMSAVPLLFFNGTTDRLETPKIIFLVFSVLGLYILWALCWVFQGRMVITKTPLDIPLLLLLLTVIVSTIFSGSRDISLIGNFPRVHGSTVAWVSYILFYFVAASNIKSKYQIITSLLALLISAILSAFIGLLSFSGLFLPLDFARFFGFNITGSAFSTSSIVALLLPLPLFFIINPTVGKTERILKEQRLVIQLISTVVATVMLAIIIILGDFSVIIASGLGVGLVLLISNSKSLTKALPFLSAPLGLGIILLIATLMPLGNYNYLNKQKVSFLNTLEPQLPFNISWQISASAFRDSPFLGTGPASYLFNFTEYKPIQINSTKFWNLRFDMAFNEFFQILGTLGGLGFVAFLFLMIVLVRFVWKNLSYRNYEGNTLYKNLLLSLSISTISAVVLLGLHVSTPVMIVVFLSLLTILMALHRSVSDKVEDLVISLSASKMMPSDRIGLDYILPVIMFVIVLAFSLVVTFFGVNIVRADLHHRQALNAANSNAITTYQQLQKATTIYNNIDAYHTDLAQTNFAIANGIAANKGPTEASPSGSLTDKDKQDIQSLLSQAINEARFATNLSPRSAQNWEILGAIYRQISGVAQNALTFSLDAYGRAIQKDPLNPQLRLNVGGVYYSAKNYDLAIRFFSDAVNLKPDFANAYYNLSIALRDKGDLQSAQATAQQAEKIVDPKSADHKVVTTYLSELKARIATNSADQTKTSEINQQSPMVPPAAEEKGPLQKKDLPKVLDLPKPSNIATPAAIKK